MGNLNNKIINSLKCDKTKDYFVTDKNGLLVRIYATGRKVYCIRIKQESGKYQLKTLGDVKDMTLKEARKLAIKYINSVKTKPISNSITVSELCNYYLENHSKIYKKRWQIDEQIIRIHIIPKIGLIKTNELKPMDMLQLYNSMQSTPIQANRLLQMWRAMWKVALGWCMIEGDDPSRAIKMRKEKPRTRWLNDDEIKRLIDAVEESDSEHLADAVKLYLLTGLRNKELLNAKWSDVDFNNQTLTIDDTKNGTPFVVNLSELAIDILQKRKKKGLYIYGGHKPITTLNRSWKTACKKAKLEDVKIHDLRRTFGSRLAQSGVSLFIIGKMLNHKSEQSTKVYAYLAKENTQEIAEQYAKKIKI